MGGSDALLSHFAFFEALAGLSEADAEWRCASAGLVTLRLFDAWVSEGASVVAPEAWSLRAVRDAIAAVDSRSAHRALLTSIVDSMELAGTVRVAVVAPRLMAYARVLQFDAKWSLAADVYRTVLAHVQPVAESDLVVAANMQLGFSLRMMADWHAATSAYTAASQVAALTGDVMNFLKSRIAEANLAMDRGNLPGAEAILDDTITSATEAGLREIRAFALQTRGNVAHRRGDYDTAIRLAYEAMGGMRDQVARDRVLADLAGTFFEIGLRSAARDANLVLAATAQEQYTRWVATINLLEIAAMDHSELVFEQYRRELAACGLPATLAAYYHYYVGQGYRMFERYDLARASLERAIEVASRHQVNEVVFKAEQALSEIRNGGVIIIAEHGQTSNAVTEVASAIREMRALAGVAG